MSAAAGGGVDVLAVIRDGFDLVPRVSEDDPMAPALADWMRQLSRAQNVVAELIAAVKCAVDLTPAEGRKDWFCHWNITTPDKCARCGPELRVIAALSSIEGASHE